MQLQQFTAFFKKTEALRVIPAQILSYVKKASVNAAETATPLFRKGVFLLRELYVPVALIVLIAPDFLHVPEFVPNGLINTFLYAGLIVTAAADCVFQLWTTVYLRRVRTFILVAAFLLVAVLPVFWLINGTGWLKKISWIANMIPPVIHTFRKSVTPVFRRVMIWIARFFK